MIPVLYEAGEKAFASEGLGRLSSATECIVTEERNGSYELEMDYPIDGMHWKDIRHSRIIYAQPADGKDPQPFRIYRIGKPMSGRCTVYAQHISYQLSHIPVMPFTARSFPAALNGLVNNAAEDCPFTVWTDKNTTGEFAVSVPTSFRALLGGTTGSLLDVFGTAEYEFDKYTIYARSSRGVDRGVILRYGKNITDIKQDENIQNTITGICPYWVDRETDQCKTLPEKVLWSENAGNFPYKRTIPVDLTDEFETEPSDSELRAAGVNYIESNGIGIPAVSVSVSFVPLWQTEEYKDIANLERVNLCDTVTVIFDKLGVSVKAKVVKTVYDVLRERYKSVEIGDARTTLADAIVKQNEATERRIDTSASVLRAYVDYITAKITGGRGGYIIFNYNADGLPEEMLIMDTPRESTATKIIRLNQNGIAFSTDGGATYKTGWTIDGVFCADFIGTGTLDANLIRAGVITDVKGTNYWDMETGEFRLAPSAKVGDSTVAAMSDVNSTVVAADVEYGNSASATASPTSWATNAAWEQGKCLWTRVKTTLKNGSISYSAPRMIANGNGIGVSKVTEQYYLSTSNTARSGGSWSDSQQTWVKGRYYWTRSKIEWADGSTTYTDPVLAAALTSGNQSTNDLDDALTQTEVFNRLTNDGKLQGIYMSDGKLYINATYIASGVLADTGGNTKFDLSTGTLTMTKGSINIGSGNFQVTAAGALTAKSATISGTFTCGSTSGYWTKLNSSGQLVGGYGSTQYGYIDYSADSYDINDSSIRYKGIQIQAGSSSQRGILRIAASKISIYPGYDTSKTATYGATGTMRVVYKEDGDYYYWRDYDFINGLLVSTPYTN